MNPIALTARSVGTVECLKPHRWNIGEAPRESNIEPPGQALSPQVDRPDLVSA
jgi:hypothetical protein